MTTTAPAASDSSGGTTTDFLAHSWLITAQDLAL
jgi:hypothetical protein